ncbi:MAG: hypothetical protein KF791_18615 [Verrucomicrobiae bacterium]|nr:hypothetical protein [Verrucomicrobiae bacterium]
MDGRRICGWLSLSLVLAAAGPAWTDDWLDAGPFASSFPTLWESGWRQEGLGTLAWWQETPERISSGLAPLLSYEYSPVLDRERFDLLYPALTWRRSGGESRFQLAQVITWIHTGQQDEQDSYIHRTVFPIYFEQRSVSGTNDYLAVLPFYGHLRNRLFRDEIEFILFPIYSRTRKGAVVTRNYVYPVFHLRAGPGLAGWQFWPLYGAQEKEITWQTNLFGDRVLSPGSNARFAVWPLFSHQRAGLGTTNEVLQTHLLPFYAIVRSPARDQTTVIWPLFTRTEDRVAGYVEWGAPWPVIGWANGPGKTARRVWPFYGNIQAGTSRRNFLLWPVYLHRHIEDTAFERDRWRSFFFLYDDTLLRSRETGEYRRETGVWPFFSWRHDPTGREQLRVPALLENFVRNREALDRNYSPLWSVYRSERDPAKGAASQSVLWNFFRRDVTASEVRTACLFGLVQTRRGADGDRHWRLLWLPNRHFQTSGEVQRAAVGSPKALPRRGTVAGPGNSRNR